ncbi:MAG: hypothetical protein J6330_05225 [Clostridia bacterium]|nr:hypothetical protein [Clostridia bacterium]
MNEINENTLKVTEYELLGKLPDPFVCDDGSRITSPDQWEKRRAEIYKTAVELQYGTQPPSPEYFEVEPLLDWSPVCKGYKIHAGTEDRRVSFRMQVILPEKHDGNVPVIVDGDMCWMYHMDRDFLNAALGNGVGWVLFDRMELAHDIEHEGRGKGALYEVYPEYTFGALGAWAWGYSRCVDALERLGLPVDLDYIAFSGHSRGGKTAALAGAIDRRARIVNPNETCAGACGCYRVHMKGEAERGGIPEFRSETLDDLMRVFGFWMGEGMEAYRTREAELPFDTHFLKAMVAPRTLFVSEAAGDIWANPVGSYQTTVAAGEVFDFLGAANNLYWYYRPGVHGHRTVDVEMLVNIIRHEKYGEPIDGRMFRLPFKDPGKAYDWKAPGRDE